MLRSDPDPGRVGRGRHGVLAVVAMVIVALWLAALLAGCVQHEVTAPQLDTLAKTVAQACQPLPLVNPIPPQMRLVINGEQIDADAAGKRLLVDYAACYSASRAAAGTAR